MKVGLKDTKRGLDSISKVAKKRLVHALDVLHQREVEAMKIMWELGKVKWRFPSALTAVISQYLVGSAGGNESKVRVMKVELVRSLESKED
mmetsp:Transcript_6569/g.12062  ORF Transcript_6569/g.12062 Transcript_6569/m.12062 type:complete len:91 (-) Transcript_6569:254-526(-)